MAADTAAQIQGRLVPGLPPLLGETHDPRVRVQPFVPPFGALPPCVPGLVCRCRICHVITLLYRMRSLSAPHPPEFIRLAEGNGKI